MTLFIGMDPGNTTGIAWVFMDDTTATDLRCAEVPQREAPGQLANLLAPHMLIIDMCVAIERFLITERTVRATRTRTPQHVGELEQECRRYGVVAELQTASDAKNFATNKTLRKIGWYRPSQGHAMDAARHLLLLIARTQPHYFERLIG